MLGRLGAPAPTIQRIGEAVMRERIGRVEAKSRLQVRDSIIRAPDSEQKVREVDVRKNVFGADLERAQILGLSFGYLLEHGERVAEVVMSFGGSGIERHRGTELADRFVEPAGIVARAAEIVPGRRVVRERASRPRPDRGRTAGGCRTSSAPT